VEAFEIPAEVGGGRRADGDNPEDVVQQQVGDHREDVVPQQAGDRQADAVPQQVGDHQEDVLQHQAGERQEDVLLLEAVPLLLESEARGAVVGEGAQPTGGIAAEKTRGEITGGGTVGGRS